MGRDEWGGAQVNLIDSEKPQDVYSGVCAVVRQKIEMDAATGDSLAQLLSGKVDRKTVKQTVMTSVYGVTYIGARDQILNRLKERKDIPWPEPADQVFAFTSLVIHLPNCWIILITIIAVDEKSRQLHRQAGV